MAMKKAEMEAHANAYRAHVQRARTAESSGLYRAAVDAAIDAWGHIDGMMQYERKYAEGQLSQLEAVDFVLKYAPLLLDARSLNRLEDFLNECKRLKRDSSLNVGELLSQARSQVPENHRLWAHLERNPGAVQSQIQRTIGGDQSRWRWVVEAWEKMGLVTRAPDPEAASYRVSLATRMGQVISAKCPACGEVAEAPKAMFLEPMTCPRCNSDQAFVFLGVKANSLMA
jgi:DNA-binding MarR family transcriptional regulator